MKNRVILNLALVVVLCVLAWFAFKRSTAPRQDDQSMLKISSLSAAQVNRLSVLKRGRAEIRLEKQGEGWRLLQPIAGRADRNQVERLLDVAGATSKSKIESADLKQFELAPPLATVTLNDQVFRFGATNGITFEQYVAVADAIFLLPTHFGASLPDDAAQLLSRMLLNEGETPVGFELPGLKLARDKDSGKWTASGSKAPSTELSQDDLNKFVDGWRFASALSAAPNKAGKEQARWSIALHDGRTIPLALVQEHPELVLARVDEQTEFHFTREMLQRLSTLAASEKTPLGVPADSANKK